MSDLKSEFQFYLANKADFLKKFEGKFIVLKGHEVLGVYSDRLEAIEKTQTQHELGTFLVQHVSSSDEEQVRFHSRYAI